MAGRLKSSRNALRHGLSIPAIADSSAPPYNFAELLATEGASQLQRQAVAELVQAQIQLQRVAAVRKGLLAELDL